VGFFHLGVGIWLMCLMFATVLDLVFKHTLYLSLGRQAGSSE